MIAERRRLAFVSFHLRPLYAFDGVMGDDIGLAQLIEQGRERRELAAHRRAGQPSRFQLLAPRDDVRSIDDAKVGRIRNANERHELAQTVGVYPPRAGVVDIGEPLGFRRDIGQA
jgi:hypothetical protein